MNCLQFGLTKFLSLQNIYYPFIFMFMKSIDKTLFLWNSKHCRLGIIIIIVLRQIKLYDDMVYTMDKQKQQTNNTIEEKKN